MSEVVLEGCRCVCEGTAQAAAVDPGFIKGGAAALQVTLVFLVAVLVGLGLWLAWKKLHQKEEDDDDNSKYY